MSCHEGTLDLAIEVVEGVNAIRGIAREWDAAIPRSFTSTLVQSGWYLAYQESFPTRRFVVVIARLHGRIVGLLPLALERTDARGLFFSHVTTFARGDYQPPVAEPTLASSVLPRLIDAAIRHFGRRYVYRWAGIPSTDAAARVLPSYLATRGMSYTVHTDIAPRLNIRGRTFAELESSWSKSHRGDVRRQRKRLSEKGPVTLFQPESLEDAIQLLHEFFDVHDEKWLSQGQPGRFQDPVERRHFELILSSMWERGAMITALRCGDVNISFAFGFFSDGWIQWYRPTYRRDYENYSPGKIHISMMLEIACERGWNGIDFLLGTESYKYQWSDERLEVHDIYSSCRPWSPAYLWFTRGKPFVRERLRPRLAILQAHLQRLLQRRKRN